MPQPIIVPQGHDPLHATDTGDLRQLVYYSTSLLAPLDAGGRDEINNILQSAQTHNKSKGVTGALTYNEFHFAQVLEGSPFAVEEIFARIKADPRHAHVRVVEEKRIVRRDFPGWIMAYVGDWNSTETISSNFQLTDIVGDANKNAVVLIEMMKFFLKSSDPKG